MSSTQVHCSRCGSALSLGAAAGSGTAACLVCGQPVLAAAWPTPGTQPTNTANARLLAFGGLAFAGLTILMLSGMTVVLLSVFSRSPTATAALDTEPAPPAPEAFVATPPTVPVVAPPAPTTTGVAPSVVAPSLVAPSLAAPSKVDPDLADLAKPSVPSTSVPSLPVPDRRGGDGPPRADLPTVVLKVPAGPPGVEQQRIDAAIARGVTYLKQTQTRNTGAWSGHWPVGCTALAGLTLLECKVPASDPQVRKAAAFIRSNAGNLYMTYEVALAILFLDRLGNPADDAIIQGLALRLVVGQNESGGWTYTNFPALTPAEMKQLLVFLRSHRPPAPPAKALQPPGEFNKQLGEASPADKQLPQRMDDDVFKQLAELQRQSTGDESWPRLAKPADTTTPPDKPAKRPDVKKETPINPRTLSPKLQQLPVVQLNLIKGKVQRTTFQQRIFDDNSNTQFALMGLWAARRHNVPTEYSLRFAQERFLNSQNQADGGWGYHLRDHSKNTMTCVGLIGLALGHGVNPDAGKGKLADPAIQAGLTALGRSIGTPTLEPDVNVAMENLYFLWSVERVAMLYDLKTIGGKDWYGWGAQTLLRHQQDRGNWTGGLYHGAADHTDTCFALLFLKRSNLIPELTENLRLNLAIRDPDAK